VRVDEHTIEVAGAPVFYRSAPWSRHPALYLHGIPTSSDDWTVFLERSGGIAPDLPGFGRTSKAEFLDYSLGGHADFIERFLAQLGVGQVALVAHGWGAGGGLTFAQRHPDRVASLVLCNALPLLDDFTWPRLARLYRLRGVGELVMGATTRRLLARTLRRADSWTDGAIGSVWEQFDQGTQRAILRLHRSIDERGLAAAGARLGDLGSPALVIWGDRDPWLAAAFAHAYGARLSDAEVVALADAGHWPWRDDASVVERVVAFLARA
jgi:pimeloyl-ACP methyl ester carboxylesterase